MGRALGVSFSAAPMFFALEGGLHSGWPLVRKIKMSIQIVEKSGAFTGSLFWLQSWPRALKPRSRKLRRR
jgi:hypothetical protein